MGGGGQITLSDPISGKGEKIAQKKTEKYRTTALRETLEPTIEGRRRMSTRRLMCEYKKATYHLRPTPEGASWSCWQPLDRWMEHLVRIGRPAGRCRSSASAPAARSVTPWWDCGGATSCSYYSETIILPVKSTRCRLLPPGQKLALGRRSWNTTATRNPRNCKI